MAQIPEMRLNPNLRNADAPYIPHAAAPLPPPHGPIYRPPPTPTHTAALTGSRVNVTDFQFNLMIWEGSMQLLLLLLLPIDAADAAACWLVELNVRSSWSCLVCRVWRKRGERKHAQ
jgi:hypothetical protein